MTDPALSPQCRRGAVQPGRPGVRRPPRRPAECRGRAPAAGNCRRAASTPDEDPRGAVLRELAEEIGTDRAEIIGEHPGLADLRSAAGSGRRGAGRPLSRPAAALVRAALHRERTRDIRLDLDPHPEFDAWRWADLRELPALAVPFKRPIYEMLAALIRALRRPLDPSRALVANRPLISPGRRRLPSSASRRRCSSRRSFSFRARCGRGARGFPRQPRGSSRSRCFFARWRLTISPIPAILVGARTNSTGRTAMGSTIDLKAADGHTLLGVYRRRPEARRAGSS